jgi:hypothetical protein
VGVDKVLGVHYDTFGFIITDHQKAIQAFEEQGIKLYLQAINSTIEL